MASRLENALIWAWNPEHPVQIVTNASKTAAAKMPHANYKSPASRKALFDIFYELPLNVANRHVKVDAFLMGVVGIDDGFRSTTVLVQAFDNRNPVSYEDVLKFEVPSDRYLLADLGQGFSTIRRGPHMMRGDDDLGSDLGGTHITDPLGIVEVESSPSDTQVSSAFTTDSPTSDFPVELRITYNGKDQTLQQEADSAQNWKLDDPEEGDQVLFHVKNLTDERLGIVLLVNGVNTLFEEYVEDKPAYKMSRWVLEPGVQYCIKGYYKEDMKQYTPILGLSEEKSKEAMEVLGDLGGYVNLYVFSSESGNGKEVPPNIVAMSRGGSFLNTVRTAADGRPARTWAELQARVARGGSPTPPRGVMIAGGEDKEEQLTEDKLDAAYNSDTMVIKYYSVAE